MRIILVPRVADKPQVTFDVRIFFRVEFNITTNYRNLLSRTVIEITKMNNI